MQKPTIESIIGVMKTKNYKVYDTPSVDWNLNIVGIRSSNTDTKKFDDLLVIFHRFMGEWNATYYPITTDPGTHYLQTDKPLSPKGTAILMEGQYKSVYKIDMHKRGRKGAHKALCQSLGNVTVYRDNDRDGSLDIDRNTIETGMFWINIHRGPRNGQIDPDNTTFSAGCQVFADDRHFADFMQKCKYGKEAFGNKFTYTLLLESDFG